MRHKLAAAALSAFLAFSCAPKSAEMPKPRPVPISKAISKEKPLLESMWDGGHCSYDPKTNTLTYGSMASGGEKTLKLDAKAEASESLLCSGSFTVLLSKDKATVAIGAVGVLDGREMLGLIGGRLVAANSYEILLGNVLPAGSPSASFSIIDNHLYLFSEERTLKLDMAEPFHGWVY
ncbi:MAG: hypothetical protein V1827_06225 [Candidatus Micrarchaeota archaeon]